MGAPSERLAAEYFDQGYCIDREAVEPQLVGELRSYILEQAAELPADAPPKIYDIYGRNPELVGRLVNHPRVVDGLRAILGRVRMVGWMHNHATINTPEDTLRLPWWHTDTLHPNRAVTTMILPMEPGNVDNQLCTWLIPESDRIPIIGDPDENNGGIELSSHPDEVAEYMRRNRDNGRDGRLVAVPLQYRPGDLVYFKSSLFHMVGKPMPKTGDLGQETEPGDVPTRVSLTLAFTTPDERSLAPDRGMIRVTGDRFRVCGNVAISRYANLIDPDDIEQAS